MIHPFAHMNSNYAAAQMRSKAASAPAGEAFQKLLTRAPEHEACIALAPEETALEEEPQEPVEPASPPVRSRTGQTEAPEPRPRSSVPHFLSVAESLQHPRGPYRQAPPEHGGEWWLTNPFTGLEPWLTQGFGDPYAAPPDETPDNADPAFLAVFGAKPNRETHPNPPLRGAAVADWERNREHFKGVGLPEGFTQEQLDAAGTLFEAWGLGRPLLYEGRYGWRAVFPEAGGFEAAPYAVLETPHLVIARHQIELAARGEAPSERHPFVPAQVFQSGYFDA